MSNTGSLEARLSANVEQFIANMVAAGNATQSQADRMARLLKAVQTELKQMNSAAAEASKSSAGLEAQAKAMEHVGFATAGAKRELLVLAHELSQGNYSRFGGSLLVLAERTNAMELAFSGAGVAIGVLGASVVGFTALVIHGAMQEAEFNKQLLLTGNYAGVTAGSMDKLSQSVASNTSVTVRAARDALGAVVASGAFGPRNLEAAGLAVAQLSRITGEETDKIVQDFAKMRDGVAKWATEHNRSMHFVSSAQVEAVRALEEAGRTEEAQQQVLRALNERLAESEKNLGFFARAWRDVKKAVSEAAAAVEDFGKTPTLEKQIADISLRIKVLKSDLQELRKPGGGYLDIFLGDRTEKEIEKLTDALGALQRSKALADNVARATADTARRQEEGIAGRETLRRIQQEVDKRSELTRKLEEYRVGVERVRAAEGQSAVSAQEEAETIAKIRERYATPESKKLDTELQNLLKTYQDEGVKLQAQIDYYRQYGRQLDDAREAVVRFRLTQGDLKGATPGQAAPIIAAARAADELQQAKAIEEAEVALRKKIDALWEMTHAQEVSAREAYVQRQIEADIPKEFQKGTEAYEARARAIRDAANASFTATTVRDAVNVVSIEGEGIAQKIREETDALTEGALARQLVIDKLRLEAKYREELKKVKGSPEDEARLQAELAIQIAKVNAARTEGYNKAREWSTGYDQAVKRFMEDATNDAANVSRVVDSTLNGVADSLTNLLMTNRGGFRALANSIVADIDRIIIKQQLSNALGVAGVSTSSGLTDMLGGLFGSVFGGNLAIDTSGAGSTGGITGGAILPNSLRGGRAGGGPVEAGGLYRVNEEGPELLTVGGDQFLMMGLRSGNVTPNPGKGAGQITVNVHMPHGANRQTGQQFGAQIAREVGRANARNN